MSDSRIHKGRAGRIAYLIAILAISAIIFFLPYLSGHAALTFFGNSSEQGAGIARAMIRSVLMQAGVVAAGIALVVVTLRRLRDIGLSGAWLVVFPLAPLQVFFTFAQAAMPTLSLATSSPYAFKSLWIELAFGLLLAVPRAGAAEENAVLKKLNRFAPQQGRISRGTFALYVALAAVFYFGVAIIISFPAMKFIPLGSILMQPTLLSRASALPFVIDITSVLIFVLLTSWTLQRLKDVGVRPWWVVFFPLGLASSLVSILTIQILLARPDTFSLLGFAFAPFMLVQTIHGIVCVLMAIYLFAQPGDNSTTGTGSPT